MGRLENLRVERVDSVDRPATHREWIVVKSEDEAEEVEKAEAIVAAAGAVLESLVKEESVTLSKETIEALNELAKLLDAELTFKEADPEEPEEPVEPEVEKTDEPTLAEQITTALETALPSALESLLEKEKAEKGVTKAKSKQPEDDPEPVKKRGRPSFADIIFDQK